LEFCARLEAVLMQSVVSLGAKPPRSAGGDIPFASTGKDPLGREDVGVDSRHALDQFGVFARRRCQVGLLFLFFHKRLCGPLANSRFHHRPDPQHRPNSRLEAAHHRADKAIQNIVDLLAAA
jgi:hypothetical protein